MADGPYIIMVRDRHPILNSSAPFGRLHSRRAVAALDEAREEARKAVDAREPFGGAPYGEWGHFATVAAELPEAGGTVGPLPDGTVIEVERVSPLVLASRCEASGLDVMESLRAKDNFADLINVYNERNGVA